jgi:hypothetical protein
MTAEKSASKVKSRKNKLMLVFGQGNARAAYNIMWSAFHFAARKACNNQQQMFL